MTQMIAEPKPRFLRIFISKKVKVKCITIIDGKEELFDFLLMPGEHTLAMKTDENGSPLGPWDPKQKIGVFNKR